MARCKGPGFNNRWGKIHACTFGKHIETEACRQELMGDEICIAGDELTGELTDSYPLYSYEVGKCLLT